MNIIQDFNLKKNMHLSMFSLMFGALIILNLEVGLVQAGETGTTTKEAEISLASWEISGTIEGGYAGVRDTRELYNPGEQAAVRYLFSMPEETNITGLEINSEGNTFSIIEAITEKTDEEVGASNHAAYVRYLNSNEAGEYLNGLVIQYSSPSFFSLHGRKLLICQFMMDQRSFLNISIRYGLALINEGGLNRLPLPLSPAVPHNAAGAGNDEDVEGRVNIEINSVRTLEAVYSPTHQLIVDRNGMHSASLRWEGTAYTGEVLDIYFNELSSAFGGGFLNYRIPAKTMFQENEDGYFMFLFSPNTEEFEEAVMPKDIVFVIDTSGSMRGEKIVRARNALKCVLESLHPEDRFAIIRFSDSVGSYCSELLPASQGEVKEAKDYVNSLKADGSTDINNALLTALDSSSTSNPERLKEIIFLTDGEPTVGVTNNEEILDNVRSKNTLGEVGATLYVFGIGYNVNTNLLDKLSMDSGGRTLYIQPHQDIEEVLDTFYQTIASPVLTDITMEVTGINVMSRFPERIPNLYNGGELNIVGMYSIGEGGPEKITVYINGTTTSGDVHFIYRFPMEEPGKHTFLPRIYAIRAVGGLLQDIKQNGETPEKVELVKRYGKRYGIETPYTSLTVHTNTQFDSEGFRTLTGKASVEASELIHSYSSSRIAGLGLIGNARTVGDRTFINLDGIFIESSLLPDEKVIDLKDSSVEEWVNTNTDIREFIRFASPEYFILAEEKTVRDILSLSPEIVFTNGEEVIGITRGNLLLYINNLTTRTFEESLCVTWDTNAPADSVLHYRGTVGNGSREWNIVRDTELTRAHNITVPIPYAKYEFFVESTDAQGNTAIRDNQNSYYTAYHFPVAIISVKANIGYAALYGDNIRVRWYTNVPADGSLYVRIANGSWQVMGNTTHTMVHEVSFIVPFDFSYHNRVTVEFYVTARTGSFYTVEDNNGEYFSFECVQTMKSSPSFDTGYALILLSIFGVVGLSTYLEYRRKNGTLKDDS